MTYGLGLSFHIIIKKTEISWAPPLFIEVPLQSQKKPERSCICVLRVYLSLRSIGSDQCYDSVVLFVFHYFLLLLSFFIFFFFFFLRIITLDNQLSKVVYFCNMLLPENELQV